MNPTPSSRRLRFFIAELFIIDFVLLVGGWALLHFNSQYVGYTHLAAWMLLGSFALSFVMASMASMHYAFRLSFKKSALATLLLCLIAALLYTIGGWIIGVRSM